MKKAGLIFWLCSILLLQSCSLLSFKEPKIESKQIEVDSVDFSKLNLRLILGIQNPNDIDIPLESLTAKLSVDENPFLERHWSDLPVLKGQQKTQVTLPLELEWQKALTTGLKFAAGKKLPYHLKGNVKVKGFTLPFDESGELSLDSAKK